eukprot:scaffold15166_cov140-Isochrysis_galbana.AAC.4
MQPTSLRQVIGYRSSVRVYCWGDVLGHRPEGRRRITLSVLLKIKAINTPLPPLFFPPTQMRGGKFGEGEGGSTSNPN